MDIHPDPTHAELYKASDDLAHFDSARVPLRVQRLDPLGKKHENQAPGN
jgi:hypothetical protein